MADENKNIASNGDEILEGEITDLAGDDCSNSETASDDPIAALKSEISGEKEKYLRLAAEYDNFRKRSAKERETIFADVRADTVTKFLQVYDNIARALSHETSDEAYKKGVELTLAQFMDTLEKMGVTAIPAIGEKFNPDVHNAIVHEQDESQGDGIITEEFQKGFKLGDKIIRFSLVKVAN